MVETALSRPPVGQADSPRTHQQEGTLEAFPTNADDFERYLGSLSCEQKDYERGLFYEDVREAAADWVLFPWLPLKLREPFVKKNKPTLIIGLGLGTTAPYYEGPKLWFQNTGRPTKVYSPETLVNVGCVNDREGDRYMELLYRERRKSNGPVDVMLHSISGVLDRYVRNKYGDEYQKLVGTTIYLGSPKQLRWVNSFVGDKYLKFFKWFLGSDDSGLRVVFESGDSAGEADTHTVSIGNPKDAV